MRDVEERQLYPVGIRAKIALVGEIVLPFEGRIQAPAVGGGMPGNSGRSSAP